MLLTTKIGIPPARPRSVPRARLVDRMQEGLAYDLILVSAPAGFGKTTLLAQWARIDRQAVHLSWLSLDEGDSDPVRFWDYFVAALETFRPGLREKALPLLHSPRPLPVESVLALLINELSIVSQDLILVLDDYQFIQSPDVHAGVAFWLEHMPASMHLVIATRADPPLPLARWRGREKMLEIGADDLRFTLDEAAEFLGVLRGSLLSPEQVEALTLRTEGWAVGLKMAALSMGQREDVSEFIAAFAGSQRYIMDYLIEEVLQQQRRELQDFLLETSVLERLTAPLCGSVTGRSDSEKLLLDLERAHLFLVPLDESREWFRYEHLFVDLLRHQLQRTSGAEAVARLHQRASTWCERHGFLRESINHSLAARDWQGAMRLIAEFSDRHTQTGEVVTLLGWLRALPQEVRGSNPQLCLLYAWTLMSTGQLDASEAVLGQLEPLVADETILLSRIIAYRALISIWRGDAPRAAALSHEALSLLSPADAILRGALTLHLGMMRWYSGLLSEAEPLLREAHETGRQVGNRWLAATALGFLSSISRWRGTLHHAVELCEKAIELVADLPAAAQPHQFFGEVLYEVNDLESATLHLTKALELNQVMGTPEVGEAASYQLMRIKLAQGDDEGARRMIEGIDQRAMTDRSPIIQSRHAAYHLDLAVAQGHLDEASRWGEELVQYDDILPFYLRHLLVPLLIADSRKEHVSEQLWKFYETVQVEWLSPEWQGWRIRTRLYQALAASEPDEALGFLAEALVAAEPEGWTRTFVDGGAALAPLLRRAASRGIAQEYATRLLVLIESEERVRAETKGRRSRPVYGLLTGREAEVLGLLAAGLSNRQIAERLFISLGTAKAHVHNISEKLNVTGRTKVIARARELHLI